MSQSDKVTEALRLIELRKGEKMSKEELRKQAFEIAAAISRQTGDPGATAENVEAAWQAQKDAEKVNSEKVNSETLKTAVHG